MPVNRDPVFGVIGVLEGIVCQILTLCEYYVVLFMVHHSPLIHKNPARSGIVSTHTLEVRKRCLDLKY